MIALLLDTETTGLTPNRILRLEKQPEIIEFYGCLVDLAQATEPPLLIAEFETLIKPMNKISKEITDITGINDAMVADAPSFADVHTVIANMIETAPVVLAHNLTFDRDMLDIEFERIMGTLHWPPCLCTVEQTEHLTGKRMSLSDLYASLFNETFKAHRAKADVQALVRVARELYKRQML